MRKFIPIVFMLLAAAFTAQAQETKHESDTLEVYFHQGYSTWDPAYRGNGKRMEDFIRRFERFHEDSTFRKITKIHISAGCSPEGSWAFNQRLSRNRVKSIRNVLDRYIELPDSIIVEKAIGINWEGLYEFVKADPKVPHRDEVIYIIENTPELYTTIDGETMELRKKRLVWNNDGKPWRYMYDNFFPTLRSFNLQIVVEWEKYILPPPPTYLT